MREGQEAAGASDGAGNAGIGRGIARMPPKRGQRQIWKAKRERDEIKMSISDMFYGARHERARFFFSRRRQRRARCQRYFHVYFRARARLTAITQAFMPIKGRPPL